ncbi:MAG: hypothetical protein WKF64_07930 [Ilumatobacteraceae bacterium]
MDDVPPRARTVHPFKLVVVGPERLAPLLGFVRAEGVAFERLDGSYVSPAHVPFASEVLAKVRTFDGLIGALEQFD